LSPVGRSSPKPERRLSRDCAPLSQDGLASLLASGPRALRLADPPAREDDLDQLRRRAAGLFADDPEPFAIDTTPLFNPGPVLCNALVTRRDRLDVLLDLAELARQDFENAPPLLNLPPLPGAAQRL
jgi:hypothetical protein